MVGQYPKECSIVFIINFNSAPFQLSHPFQFRLPPSLVAYTHWVVCAAVEKCDVTIERRARKRSFQTLTKWENVLTLQSLIKQWDIKAKHPLSGNLYDINLCGVAYEHLLASTFSLSLRYSYATSHCVITSYRSPDLGCFALL